MREFYERCTIIYDDYRTAIPSYAAAALSFYLLLLLIPAFTLIAIGTSLFNIDMTILQNIIEQFVVKEYAQMLIDILQSRSFNTVAFVTILVSIYTVSRGVGNIYEISKRMYHPETEETILGYYIYTIKVTIYLLLLLIGVIAITAIGPLAYIFNFLYSCNLLTPNSFIL